MEGYQLLPSPSPGISLLPANTQSPPRGLSFFSSEARRRGQRQHRHFNPDPGRPRGRSWSSGAGLRRAPRTGCLGTGLSVRQVRARGAPRARSQAERGSLTAVRVAMLRAPPAALRGARLDPAEEEGATTPACRVRLFQVPAEARLPRVLRPWGVPPGSPSSLT